MSCHYGKVMEGWDEAMEGIYRVWWKGKSGAHLYRRPAGFRPLKGHRGSCLWEGSLESAAIRCHSLPFAESWDERDCLLKVIHLASSGFSLYLSETSKLQPGI